MLGFIELFSSTLGPRNASPRQKETLHDPLLRRRPAAAHLVDDQAPDHGGCSGVVSPQEIRKCEDARPQGHCDKFSIYLHQFHNLSN